MSVNVDIYLHPTVKLHNGVHATDSINHLCTLFVVFNLRIHSALTQSTLLSCTFQNFVKVQVNDKFTKNCDNLLYTVTASAASVYTSFLNCSMLIIKLNIFGKFAINRNQIQS